MCPCQSEPVALHGELALPPGASHEWLYLAQWRRAKGNKALEWSVQISELLLFMAVAEWNARSSYLAFFSSDISGFEAEREFNIARSYFLWV